MRDQDKQKFLKMMQATLAIFDKSASNETVGIWWKLLASYEFSDVEIAFSRYLATTEGKFAPKPASIIAIIEAIRPDGRPGADEAWAMIPRDESATAVMSQEMHEALGIAQPLLDEGDKIGARMAFKEAYCLIVERNKFSGVAPAWSVSLGWDVNGRESVIREAILFGRLSEEHVHSAGLLPDRSLTGIAATLIEGAPLRLATVNGDVVEDADRHRDVVAKLAGLRAAIGMSK